MPFVEPGFVEPGYVEGDALLDVLNTPEKTINVVVELDSTNRTTGSARTWIFPLFIDTLIADAHPEALPYLSSVGQISKSLSADSLFGGLAEVSGGNITLLQNFPASDKLSEMLDYSFSGKTATIKVGRLNFDPYTDYTILETLNVEQEPMLSLVDSGIQVTLPLASAINNLLAQWVPINRYLGVSTCARLSTASAAAIAPHISAYDLTHFALIAWFRLPANPSAELILSQKALAGENNWIFSIDTAGKVHAEASTPGESFAFSATSPTSLADDNFHTAVLSVNGAGEDSYLMVDGVITNTFMAAGLIDTPNTSIVMGSRASGTTNLDLCYEVLVSKFLSADEARAIATRRQDFSDSIYVGAWMFDDGDPAVAALDYSANNNSATFTGARNTDYSWQPSDLGESAIAGKAHPYILGLPFNYLPDLIDTARGRYRVSSVDLVSSDDREVNVKSQGTLLVSGVDYTFPTNQIFQTTSAEDQPVTVDSVLAAILPGDPGRENTVIGNVYDTVAGIMSIDTATRDRMINLTPWLSGYFTPDVPTYGDIVSQLFSGSSIYYSQDELGRFTSGYLLPPLGANVYGGPVLDFRGGSGLDFDPVGNVTGSRTIAFWYQTPAVDQDPQFGRPPQVIASRPGNYEVTYSPSGFHTGKFRVVLGDSIDFFTPAGLIQEGVKTFIALSYDSVGDTCKVYVCPAGGILTLAHTKNTDPTVDSFSSRITLGSLVWGSVSHFQIHNTALNSTQIQGLIDTETVGTESGLVFYVKATERPSRTVSELVSGTTATVDSVARWAPVIDLDLSLYPSVRLTEYKNQEPAWRIIIRYSRNWRVLSDSEIDIGVTDRAILREEWQESPWEDSSIKTRYPRARALTLDSTLVRVSDAQKLLRMLRTRLAPGRVLASLSFATGDAISMAARRALGLRLEDEVRLISPIPSIDRHLRVVAISKDPVQVAANVVLWG